MTTFAAARAHIEERFRLQAERDLRASEEVRAKLERELASLSRKYNIERAFLFGSLAWGGFSEERSDVDLLVFGPNPIQMIELTALLGDALRRSVHALAPSEAPTTLVERVLREGVELCVTQ